MPSSNLFLQGTPTAVDPNWKPDYSKLPQSAGYKGYTGPAYTPPSWAANQIKQIQSGKMDVSQGVYGNSPGSIPQSSRPYTDPNTGMVVGSPEWMSLMRAINPQSFSDQGPLMALSAQPNGIQMPNLMSGFSSPLGFPNYATMSDPFANYQF